MTCEIQRFNLEALTSSIAGASPQRRCSSPLPVGMPFLVDRETRKIFQEEFLYLRSICDVATRSETGRYPHQSGSACAQSLKSWREHLEAEGVDLAHADDEIFGLWVGDLLVARDPRNGRRIQKRTIENRINAVRRFNTFTNAASLTAIEIDYETAKCRAWGVDSRYDAKGRALKFKDFDALRSQMIRPLTREIWMRVEQNLGPKPSEWVEGGPSSRARLSSGFGIKAGLRGIEMTGVFAEPLMQLLIDDPVREYALAVRRTKGSDHREVLFHGRELLEAQAYFRGERAACLKAARILHGSGWEEPPELLVNGQGSGLHVGGPAQTSTLQRDFRVVQERLGIVVRVTGWDEDGEPREIVLPLHCLHDLRHTYAHFHFQLAVARGDADPTSVVQFRLGHAQRSTTERMYLFPDRRHVARVGDLVTEACGAILRG